MDLCQVGLVTGADVDDVLCDGAVPIKGSHPGQHLTPLRVVSDGDIEWSIRHLCVQGEGRRYDKGTLEMCSRRFSWMTRVQSHVRSTSRNTQKELGGIQRRQWKEYIQYIEQDMVRGVVIVAITPEQVQPPMTSVQ